MSLQHKRRKDATWLYGWFWFPLRRAGRYLTSLDFFELILMVIMILLVCMSLFCIVMAFLAAFAMPQHNAVLAVIFEIS